MSPPDPAKDAWQATVAEAGPPTLDQLRPGADKFYRFVRRRNLVEYAASVIVVTAYSIYVFTMPHLLQKLGSGMIALAAVYVAWQLHRRASAVPPERAGAMPILAFARGQLVRQRDALRSVFWWYLLPFIPGFVIFVAGNAGAAAHNRAAIVPLRWGDWAFLFFVGLLFLAIWRFNQRVVRKLQKAIDEIDALTGGNG